jgi:hypothetical protein
MKTTRRLRKKIWWIPLLLGMMLGLFFGVRSVFAQYFIYDGNQALSSSKPCYVSPGQTVVAWKSATLPRRCRESIAGVCIWPIPHNHDTYKVTVNDGIPLRTEQGNVIAAVNGEERSNWVTYDSESWNALPNNRFERYQFSDFEPIAPNEYVVMVETRYRLFNNVDSTLGICVQSQ